MWSRVPWRSRRQRALTSARPIISRRLARLAGWRRLAAVMLTALLAVAGLPPIADASRPPGPVGGSVSQLSPTAGPTPRPTGPRGALDFATDTSSTLQLYLSNNPISPGGTI